MRMRVMVLGVAVAGALAGPAGAQTPPSTPDPHITDGTLQARLDKARASWKAARITSYRMRVRISCFCAPETPPTLRVRHGSPVHPPARYASVATVPRLFRTIQHAIDDKVAGLTVRYGVHGVPASIAIDPSRMIADEEAYYTIDRFARLSG
ncbi:DUF6174 domain-containing protein [Paraconexibacter antarcticus]|uniref:DUF6174 domain-containing protein n=1 Tax=Paraconexibacter antarcticus TaxID=2949664 RepID=A0ABY5DU18_9ACTN|nr:DUF6174 domain-containing protein [Paraconexibacter antarcticus]UTI64486.1 DUF6174 domain-containing protein [Paraconexibacter antarcticus]